MSTRKVTNGDQLVNKINKIDLEKICNNFINNYYNFWVTDVNKLLTSKMWKSFTKFCIEGKNVTPEEAIVFHQKLSGCKFKLLNKQFIPDGSRRLDIMVKGLFFKNQLNQGIVQTFALVEIKDTFYIKSTQIFLI